MDKLDKALTLNSIGMVLAIFPAFISPGSWLLVGVGVFGLLLMLVAFLMAKFA